MIDLVAQTGADAANAVAADSGNGWTEILLSGGIVGVIILLILFALSVAAAYLLFDQVMTLRRSEIVPDGVSDAVRQSLLTGRVADADAACRRAPSVLSVVLLSGLSELEFGWTEVEKALEDSLAGQAARLMRRIEYLSVIGNIAPMVGLLGTVTGMIFAFQQVATTRGAAGAGDLAEGIYQALVTTVGGLIVAIPSLGVYAVCRNRVDSLIAEVAYQSQHALAPIKRRQTNRARATPAIAKTPGPQPAASATAGPKNGGPKNGGPKNMGPRNAGPPGATKPPPAKPNQPPASPDRPPA
ncbi:Biopolymer transport protein ExbB [Rubripirellula lacrimiformis]|uniref:Biopolymer transport protein ExbB n=1 Tax=Rubripirellula lacrimiformis TaxID=1930273 RepID=A0A517NBC4_9BACT|nr:MotA/TolQ/ExbB proton channel family protein [Rubripirellula lacrimiformis]QDT04328.1 Biopolymer transport protein ExbB [Rubripirellula lacrimiformis]